MLSRNKIYNQENKTKKNLIFFFIFFCNINIFSFIFANNRNYYPLSFLLSLIDIEIEYDNLFDIIILYKDEKKVLLSLYTNFLIINNNKFFLKDFIYCENNQYYIPKDGFIEILNFFSNKKIDKKLINQEDVENNKINKIDNKIIKKNNKKTINAIIIDPGHGGKDPGAVGYNNIQEKDIVLKVSLIIYEMLKNIYPDKNIILTRYKDEFIKLEDRAIISNNIYEKYGDSIFISIHVNASISKKTYGFETWYLVSNYKRKVINEEKLKSEPDIENVLNSMMLDEIYKESKDLAKKIQDNLEKNIGNVSKNRGIKEETYFVIKKAIMPAVLVEIGFNTNKYEAIRLTKYSYLNKISKGIVDGINEFILSYEKTKGYTK